MKHVMVDLETWGLVPGCDIRSIGAVVFCPDSGELRDEFYVNVRTPWFMVRQWWWPFGKLHRDPSTVKWWAEQGSAAQAALEGGRVPLGDALDLFEKWWNGVTAHAPATFWAHGPHFDETILSACYRALGRKTPWTHRVPRDFRTIVEAVGGVSLPFLGVQHNALDDAKHQARVVMAAMRHIAQGRRLLTDSAALFREYEAHHRAKIEEAGRPGKAHRNALIAGAIEEYLAA